MAMIAQFDTMKFGATASLVRAISALKLTAEIQVKNESKDTTDYVQVQRSKPVTITATIELYTALGADVRTDAETLLTWARKGHTGYFYVAGKKAFGWKVMLTKAEISYTTFLPGSGTPTGAKVNCTWMQCEEAKESTPAKTTSGGGGTTTKKTTTGNAQDNRIQKKIDDQGALARLNSAVKEANKATAPAKGSGTTTTAVAQNIVKEVKSNPQSVATAIKAAATATVRSAPKAVTPTTTKKATTATKSLLTMLKK